MATARSKIWIERDGRPLIGKGRAKLLEEIERTGSIRHAASNLGLSYRHAWGIVSKIGEAAGRPVVISTRGGAKGGCSRLSDEGRRLLEMYRWAEAAGPKLAPGSLEKIECKVTKVDRSRKLVRLHSVSGKDDLVITITGGKLWRGLSPGDEISLTLG